jgi:hypothetical protein
MTGLRTFFYYLAAFAGGALIWGLTFYLHARGSGSISVEGTEDPYYPIVSAVPILLNVLPQLAAAVLLRKLARRRAWRAAWQWLAAGTAISLALVFVFGWLGVALERARFSLELQGAKTILLFILLGPMILTTKPLWLPALAVALVSLLLWLVETGLMGQRTQN